MSYTLNPALDPLIESTTLAGARTAIEVDSATEVTTKVSNHAATPHPTAGEKSALAGTTGTPGVANEFVTTTDTRMADARTPTAHTHPASAITDFDTAVAANSAVTANTAKVSNETHTGDVTGATALTIANDAVTNAKLANVDTATIKGRNTAGTGDLEDLTPTQARGILNVADGATANSSDADLRNRVTHTGSQSAGTISNFAVAVSANADVTANTAKRSYPSEDETKLAGIATGATANATNAELRDRTTHTGEQAISTVTGLQAALDAKAALTMFTEAGMGAIVHGATAGTARDSRFLIITWIGSVEPTNAAANDIWIDTSA